MYFIKYLVSSTAAFFWVGTNNRSKCCYHCYYYYLYRTYIMKKEITASDQTGVGYEEDNLHRF